MIIDSHVHIFSSELANNDLNDWFYKYKKSSNYEFGLEQLIIEMNNNSIEKSIVLPIYNSTNYKETNDYMYKMQQLEPKRLICFGCIWLQDIKSSIDELKRIKYELNLKGIKINPTHSKFYPNDEKYFKIYETIENMDLPILFHSGFGGFERLVDRYSEPLLLDDIACSFSNLKIIIAHGGRYFYDQTAMLLRKHSNVYTEISTNLPKFSGDIEIRNLLLVDLLVKIKKMIGNLDKVFFGSDFPFRDMSETIDILISAEDKNYINSSDITNILHNNLKNNLGKMLE